MEFSTRGIIPHAIFDSGGLGVEIVRTWGAACCAPTLSFGEVTIAGVADCVKAARERRTPNGFAPWSDVVSANKVSYREKTAP